MTCKTVKILPRNFLFKEKSLNHINSEDVCISLQQDLIALEQWSHLSGKSFQPYKMQILCTMYLLQTRKAP